MALPANPDAENTSSFLTVCLNLCPILLLQYRRCTMSRAMETLTSLLALAEAMQVDLAEERKQPAGRERQAALVASPLDHRGEDDVTPKRGNVNWSVGANAGGLE
jgi:hypothetical protein